MMYRLTGGNYLHSSHETQPLSSPEVQQEPAEIPPQVEPPQEGVEEPAEKEAEEPTKVAEFEFG